MGRNADWGIAVGHDYWCQQDECRRCDDRRELEVGLWAAFPRLRSAHCGGCGRTAYTFTEREAADLVELIVAWASEPDRARLSILDALEVPFERLLRGGYGGSCTCEDRLWFNGEEVPSSGYHLYRLWTREEQLLYVGVSTVLRDRLATHRRTWAGLWETATWDEHPDAASMMAAEADAIRDECPAMNRAGVFRRQGVEAVNRGGEA